jgi:hypothetical protein
MIKLIVNYQYRAKLGTFEKSSTIMIFDTIDEIDDNNINARLTLLHGTNYYYQVIDMSQLSLQAIYL